MIQPATHTASKQDSQPVGKARHSLKQQVPLFVFPWNLSLHSFLCEVALDSWRGRVSEVSHNNTSRQRPLVCPLTISESQHSCWPLSWLKLHFLILHRFNCWLLKGNAVLFESVMCWGVGGGGGQHTEWTTPTGCLAQVSPCQTQYVQRGLVPKATSNRPEVVLPSVVCSEVLETYCTFKPALEQY